MRRRKRPWLLLVLTALIAVVLWVCIPVWVIPVLYSFFVLLPITASLLLVRRELIDHKRAVGEWLLTRLCRMKKCIRSRVLWVDTLHTMAGIKSRGIHPNRAGPLQASF